MTQPDQIRECLQFVAVLRELIRKADGGGTIEVTEQDSGLLLSSTVFDRLSARLLSEPDEFLYQAVTNQDHFAAFFLEDALQRARNQAPCLERVRRFSDLNIGYSLEPRVRFQKRLSAEPGAPSCLAELFHALEQAYPQQVQSEGRSILVTP